MATLAVICGADNWTEVEFFGHQKQAWLETFLELPHGMPSHDTLGRVFGLLDPAQLEACFAAWVQSLATTLQDGGVAVDGKAARGSHDRARGVSPLHLVSAWVDEARLVLGQRRVDDRSNEITAIPALLETLALDDCLVTIDAMGCQKRIAQTLRDRGADYVLALKGNQPQLHEAVVETFAVEQAEDFEGCDHDFHQTVNKNHGRIETRRCGVLGTPDYRRYVDPDGAWPDLHSLIMIEAQRRQGDQVTSETRYYIPACRRMRGLCCRPCAATGALRMPSTGPGHGLPGGRKPHPQPATPPTTCPSCGGWPSTCCAARPPPRAASPGALRTMSAAPVRLRAPAVAVYVSLAKYIVPLQFSPTIRTVPHSCVHVLEMQECNQSHDSGTMP